MIRLVNMPFASVFKPSLALGLIQSQLREGGLACETLNLNVDFAEKMGFANYEFINLIRRYETQIGEWLFTDQAWGEGFEKNPEQVLDRICSESLQLYRVSDPRAWFMDIRQRVVPQFLDNCMERVFCNGEPRIVAFSSLYFQNIAIFALARRIKEKAPGVKIVCGGPNFHGEMGLEYIKALPFIDVVSLGEAEDVILPLFQGLLQGREPENLQGIVYRRSDGSVHLSAPSRPVSAGVMEETPFPDFSDFFTEIDKHGLLQDPGWKKCSYLPFESSRGCWKGDRQHCAFCGLNHQGLGFRHKSSGRVLDTLHHYASAYPVTRYHATDNVIPEDFFYNFLGKLEQRPLPGNRRVFWEVRSTLKRERIRAFAQAGIRILQPGIESLSTPLLKAMRKGVTGLKNVHFLKVCRNYGIHVIWNMMCGIPGERAEDYAEICELIPKILHFMPPSGGLRIIEMHKFSPYYSETVENGRWARRVEPQRWYNSLYPAEKVDLNRIAYFFNADWKDVLKPEAYETLTRKIEAWTDVWQKSPSLPLLCWSPHGQDGLRITDTRGLSKQGIWELDALEASIYRAIDDPATTSSVLRQLGLDPSRRHEIQAILDSFVKARLAIREGSLYLGLALPQGIFEPEFHWRTKEIRISACEYYEII